MLGKLTEVADRQLAILERTSAAPTGRSATSRGVRPAKPLRQSPEQPPADAPPTIDTSSAPKFGELEDEYFKLRRAGGASESAISTGRMRAATFKALVGDRPIDCYLPIGYRCPQGQLLAYATTDRTAYRHYKSDPAICRSCPLLASCTSSRNATLLIIRHVWADARERADAHRLTPWGKRIYKRRKETVERSFADAKQLLHGHRYARFRGLLAVTSSAYSPPQPRTSRRSLSPWLPSLYWA